MNIKNEKARTFTLVFTAIMAALIILMTLTGIGYIPVGPFKMTLNTLPVAVGAVLCGPTAGFLLGLTFGLTSFATGLFGIDALGAIVISLGFKETLLLAVTCIVPRILCGLIPGLISAWMQKKGVHWVLYASIGCGLTALINTILFLGFFWFCFAQDFVQSQKLIELFGGTIVDSFGILFALFAGWNALIEIIINLTIGTAIVKALLATKTRLH